MSNPYEELARDGTPIDSGDNPYAKLSPSSKPTRKKAMWETASETIGDTLDSAFNAATIGIADRIKPTMEIKGEDGVFRPAEGQTPEERRARSPIASTVGSIGGSIAPAGLISKGLAHVAPWLGKLGYASVAANQGLTGGIQTAAEDAIQGQFKPGHIASSAALSATLAPLFTAISRVVSPSNRARASGDDLTNADRAAAKEIASRGVPLRADEAVGAVAPGRAAHVEGRYDRAAVSPEGSKANRNFEASRLPVLNQTVDKIASAFGPGVKDGSVGQSAAEKAMRDAKALVDNSAEPYYKRANPAMVKGVDKKGYYVDEAMENVRNDEGKMRAIGKMKEHQIGFLDWVQKELKGIANRAEGRSDGGKMDLAVQDRQKLLKAMDTAAPEYKEARGILRDGKDMLLNPLEAGPLGTMSKTGKVSTQENALFGAKTPEEADAAINAAKRLSIQDPNVPQGLLSSHINRLGETKQPTKFAESFPLGNEAERVARQANPKAMTDTQPTVDALRAVRLDRRKAHENNPGGPVDDIWQNVVNLGEGRVAKLMQDPEFIDKLGKMSGGQFILQLLATEAARTGGNSELVPPSLR